MKIELTEGGLTVSTTRTGASITGHRDAFRTDNDHDTITLDLDRDEMKALRDELDRQLRQPQGLGPAIPNYTGV